MKKIRIPFSLTECQKGDYKVETRGDENHKPKKVRILCTDKKSKDGYPILALCTDYEGEEQDYSYTAIGEFFSNRESSEDLLLVKQEFEDEDIVYCTTKGERGDFDIQHFIFIYGDKNRPCLAYNLLKNGKWELCDCSNYEYDEIRLATEDEKQKFLSSLEENGKKLDAEKKCTEDINLGKIKTNKH